MAAGAASRPRDLATMATAETEAYPLTSGHVRRSRRPSRRGPSRCPWCRHGRPPAARAQVSAAGAASLRDRRAAVGPGAARSAVLPFAPLGPGRGARRESRPGAVPSACGPSGRLRVGTGGERGAGLRAGELSCRKAAVLGQPSVGRASVAAAVGPIHPGGENDGIAAVRRWRGRRPWRSSESRRCGTEGNGVCAVSPLLSPSVAFLRRLFSAQSCGASPFSEKQTKCEQISDR